jgi:hypothetical protein
MAPGAPGVLIATACVVPRVIVAQPVNAISPAMEMWYAFNVRRLHASF